MKKAITRADLDNLSTGSVFLATGGGGDPYVMQLLAEQVLGDDGSLELVQPEDLPDDALVLPIGDSGAPTVSLEQLPRGDEGIEAVKAYEDWTGKKVTHLVSFEIGGGNSVVPLIAAAQLGLPLVDGDGMGRALPEAQMMTFAIEGVKPTPAVAIDYLGNTVYFNTKDTAYYEKQLRALAACMGGMICTAEQLMTAEEARRSVVPQTVSFAIEIGRIINSNRGTADELFEPLRQAFAETDYGDLYHLYTGKVVDTTSKVVGGFDVGQVRIEHFSGAAEPMTINIKNEYLVAKIGDQVVATVPDLICMVDHESSKPINAERLRYGQRVTVYGVGCPPHYRTERALDVVAPRCFNFDLDFVPIEDLQN